jgi:hypothetical protein
MPSPNAVIIPYKEQPFHMENALAGIGAIVIPSKSAVSGGGAEADGIISLRNQMPE